MRLSHPLHPSLSSSLLVLSLKHGCPSSPPAVVRAVRVHGALPAVLLGLHSAEHAAVVGYGGRRLAAAVGGPVAGLHGGTRLARATSGNRWVRAAQRWIPHMQATGTANRTAHTLQCPRLDRVAHSAAAVRGGALPLPAARGCCACVACGVGRRMSHHSSSLRRAERLIRFLPRDMRCSTYESTSADDVIVTVPEEGIYLTMIALLKPGDHVVRGRVGPCPAGGRNPEATYFGAMSR
jgi:hypothetical protein